MKVVKIGGSLFVDRENIKKVKQVLSGETILIVSAFGKTSSKIKSLFYSNSHTSNEIENSFSDIVNVYEEIDFKSDVFEREYQTALNRFESVLNSLSILNEKPLELLDELYSYGELLSSRLISEYLISEDIDNTFIDVRDFIITNSDFGNAKPIKDKCFSNLQTLRNSNNKIIITQGFIASDEHGNTTSMGFESSNLSAILFSNALKVDSIEIITKSGGIYSLDPESYKSKMFISEMNYNSAIELSKNGFKLFYPGMIEMAKSNNIEIIFRGFDMNKSSKISSVADDNISLILKNGEKVLITPIENIKLEKFLRSEFAENSDYYYKSNSKVLVISSSKFDEEDLNKFFNHSS